MTYRIRVLCKFGLTLILFLILGYQMDLGLLLENLATASPLLVLAATTIHILSVLISVLRWKIILINFDIDTRYGILAKITFIGFFFNLFLPSGIGGDFFRAYYLAKRETRGMSTTITTTFLERSAGLCALLVLGTTSAAVGQITVEGIPLLFIFLPLVGAYLLSNLVLFHPRIHRLLNQFLQRRNWQAMLEKMEFVYEGLNRLRHSKKSVAGALLISIGVQFLSVVTVWVTAMAVPIEAPFIAFLVFVPLINLTIMVPLTINGLGLREALFYLFFSQIGFPAELSVTLSLLTFGVYVLTALPGVIIYSLYKREEPEIIDAFSNR